MHESLSNNKDNDGATALLMQVTLFHCAPNEVRERVRYVTCGLDSHLEGSEATTRRSVYLYRGMSIYIYKTISCGVGAKQKFRQSFIA